MPRKNPLVLDSIKWKERLKKIKPTHYSVIEKYVCSLQDYLYYTFDYFNLELFEKLKSYNKEKSKETIKLLKALQKQIESISDLVDKIDPNYDSHELDRVIMMLQSIKPNIRQAMSILENNKAVNIKNKDGQIVRKEHGLSEGIKH